MMFVNNSRLISLTLKFFKYIRLKLIFNNNLNYFTIDMFGTLKTNFKIFRRDVSYHIFHASVGNSTIEKMRAYETDYNHGNRLLFKKFQFAGKEGEINRRNITDDQKNIVRQHLVGLEYLGYGHDY